MTPFLSRCRRLALGLALAGGAGFSTAQAPPPPPPSLSPPLTQEAPPRVGDATHRLLALQRGGRVASQAAQPIAGEVAGRSYQRYLRSFEQPIPASFAATVKPAGGTP
jgi:hypothetical protein